MNGYMIMMVARMRREEMTRQAERDRHAAGRRQDGTEPPAAGRAGRRFARKPARREAWRAAAPTATGR